MLEQEREFNFNSMRYFDELKRSMNYLAQNEKTLFIGQAVEVPGTAMSNTLKAINPNKLIELPVTEEMQMGITIGLGLLLAMNQLINHLDKINIMSNNSYKIKTIIRTGVGSQYPLHPQHQHIGDFTEAVRKMCSSIDIIKLNNAKDIFPSYEKALNRKDGRSTILVEFGDYLNEK